MLARPLLPVLLIGLSLATAAGASPPYEAPAVGPAAIYKSRCGSCHELDRNRAGPQHRGVVGRKSGAVPGFAYSPALKASGIVWNRQTLDNWLKGPRKVVPGTRMFTSVPDAATREVIINYLESER